MICSIIYRLREVTDFLTILLPIQSSRTKTHPKRYLMEKWIEEDEIEYEKRQAAQVTEPIPNASHPSETNSSERNLTDNLYGKKTLTQAEFDAWAKETFGDKLIPNNSDDPSKEDKSTVKYEVRFISKPANTETRAGNPLSPFGLITSADVLRYFCSKAALRLRELIR